MSFVNLHVHTEYSLLDGAARIKDVVARAKELGMDSLAITDHGVMFGVIEFYRECEKQGIKPIIGCEVYTAARTRFDKDSETDRRMGHLILLAETNEGYHNIVKIVSEGFRNGFYYKPRIDKDVLKKHSNGVIALSGCIAGDIPKKLLEGDYEGAKAEALEYLSIFGEDNFFLEIQDHGLEEEVAILPQMKKLSKETGIPLVATNDSHYVNREDAEIQDILMCIQMQTTVDDPGRMKFANDQFYLKSEDEMRKIFSNTPEAVDNTQKIADRCHVEFTFGELHLPEFHAPDGYTNSEYLRHLCEEGLKSRYEDVSDEIKDRLEHEINTIEKMGYVEYFLIVWDFINYAKSNGIAVGPGRGCCSGNTKVQTHRGLIPMSQVKTGDFVYTHRGRLKKVEATFKYDVWEDLCSIVCEEEDPAVNAFTKDHKVLAIKKDSSSIEPQWHEVGELSAGDMVAYPDTHNTYKTTDCYGLRMIRKVENVERPSYVYDIAVNEDHSYMTKDFAAHNSAAGSIVAYTLGITNIDPMKYSLIFERFLNPERVSMPDIDIDFCYERRGEVIDYVTEKYGKDNVSQITSLGTMKARMAVRDVGRALGATYQEADRIAKAIPADPKMTLKKAFEVSPDLTAIYHSDTEAKKIIDVAMALEGMPRHASTHAAGVVISKLPLDEYVPLFRSSKGLSAQFNMTTIEELGLLKMDFLGLKNLTIIRDALDMIKKNHGVEIDFDNMEYDDAKVFETIAKGNTQGIFQLESGGMTSFMKALKPDCFEDIIAGIALYRPGPMASIPRYIENKKNPEKATYLHEKLKPILSVTYGCMVYQEQVMQIVQSLGGYTYGQADLVRRAMGKKKMDVMLKEKRHFLAGCAENGIEKYIAEEIFNQMISFAEYAFNKSHAAAYAVIAYETAYLKTHYPVEFMAALMSSVMGKATSMAHYIQNCKDMGIKVLPPDVNKSQEKFTVENGKIRFGLLAVKNLGSSAIESIIAARGEKGFPDLQSMIENIDLTKVNKRAVESMIKAGAMDCFTKNKASLLAAYEELMNSAQRSAKKTIQGQLSMFQTNADSMEAGREKLPNVPDFSEDMLTSFEKEMLGVYLTRHPLEKYEKFIRNNVTVTSQDFDDVDADEDGTAMENTNIYDGMRAVIAGIVTETRVIFTKKGQMMSFITVEDLYGPIEVVVFPKVYEKYKDLTEEEKIISIKGRVDFKDGESPKILADTIVDLKELKEGLELPEAEIMQPVKEKPKGIIKIRLPRLSASQEEDLVKEIVALIQAYPGEYMPILYYPREGAKKADRRFWVEPSMQFRQKLIDLVGAENCKWYRYASKEE